MNVLALKFISFTRNQNAGGIHLTWKVVKDEAIKSFRIEQSRNGIDFTQIGFVDKAEKSGEAVGLWEYQFYDPGIIS